MLKNYGKEGKKKADELVAEAEAEAGLLLEKARLEIETAREKLEKQRQALENEQEAFRKQVEKERTELDRMKKEVDESRYEYQTKLELHQQEQNDLYQRREELHRQELILREETARLQEQETRLQDRDRELAALEKSLEERKANLEQQQEILNQKESSLQQREIAFEQQQAASAQNDKEYAAEAAEADELEKKSKVMPRDTELKPGMVGDPYHFLLDLETIHPQRIKVLAVEGLEDIGLTYDMETSVISGIPLSDGKRTITLRYQFANVSADHPPELEERFELPILPDPKSLWKDIPPPEGAAFFKESQDSILIKFPQKTALGASRRGRSHAHEGSFRDDHLLIEGLADDWILLSVADGAGSAVYSREGSRIACETAAVCIRQHLTASGLEEMILLCHEDKSRYGDLKLILYNLLGRAVFDARNRIKSTAETNGHSAKDYATTLILSLVKSFPFGDFVAGYWVGDGAAAIYTGEEVILLGIPDGGEFAGQTRFLTMAEITASQDISNRIHFQFTDRMEALFLMTDGVSDPKFQTDHNLKVVSHWQELWKDIRAKVDLDTPETAEAQLLEWLNFWSKGNHDDRTLAILY